MCFCVYQLLNLVLFLKLSVLSFDCTKLHFLWAVRVVALRLESKHVLMHMQSTFALTGGWSHFLVPRRML